MTFFRTCIYICIGLIVFNFSVIFIDSLDAFDTGGSPTTLGADNASDALDTFTDLDSGDEELSMSWFWGTLIAGGGAGFLVAFLTKQIAPAGAIIFGSVFWASFIQTWSVLNVNQVFDIYLPHFLIIFFVVCLFLFIAAVIGMFTGSG